MDISSLKPYHGYQSSITPLTSGYYVYLASWDKTPTDFPQLANVWLITPEDNRILFADPPECSEIVSLYHDFHEIYGAEITLNWISGNQLNVRCRSLDGQFDLTIDYHLEETWASRLLVSLGSGPPHTVQAVQADACSFKLPGEFAGSKEGIIPVGVYRNRSTFLSW